jgi:hypothetical protein
MGRPGARVDLSCTSDYSVLHYWRVVTLLFLRADGSRRSLSCLLAASTTKTGGFTDGTSTYLSAGREANKQKEGKRTEAQKYETSWG